MPFNIFYYFNLFEINIVSFVFVFRFASLIKINLNKNNENFNKIFMHPFTWGNDSIL